MLLHAWECGNSLFCLLLWSDCRFFSLFGTDLQTVQIFLISHRRSTVSLWRIWAFPRFCLCCCWKWQNYCQSPIDEGPTKSGLLQYSQGCSHCEILADLWSTPSFVLLKKSQGRAIGNLVSKCCHRVRMIAILFLNSRHQVRSLVWVWINWKMGLTDGGSHFRMRIILGTILNWFLVFHVCVPVCSRNGSGIRPNLWVQEKLV